MSQDQNADTSRPTWTAVAASPRVLTPEAQRALAEAEERRRQAGDASSTAKEIDGRKGPEPVRFGDWEVKGLATDF